MEMYMEGRLELDMRGFVVDLAFNALEDIAYGVGGKINRTIQEALQVPAGAITAWNQLEFVKENEMDIRISKLVGEALMKQVKEELDQKEIKNALRKISTVWSPELREISP
jgi:hypothetical protein